MEGATLGVMLQMTGDTVTPTLKGFGTTLVSTKMAIRELAMGTAMLGASFMAMGVALKDSKSEMGKTISHTLMMVGSIMLAFSAAVQFISALTKIISALRTIITSEILIKAFQGPLGWAMLAGGVAATAGTFAGINAINKGEKTKSGSTTVNVHNYGSVVTEKALVESVRQGIVQGQNRIAGAGAMP